MTCPKTFYTVKYVLTSNENKQNIILHQHLIQLLWGVGLLAVLAMSAIGRI